VIKGNTVTQAATGIQVDTAKSTQVLANKVFSIFGPSGAGISVNGADSHVSGNSIENVVPDGLRVVGADPIVQTNRLVAANAASVFCAPCTGGSVGLNFNQGSSSLGLYVASDAAGLVVKSNTVKDAASVGLGISGTSIDAALNSVAGTRDGQPCFLVFGAGTTLGRNTALGCGGAGFSFYGNNLSADVNVVTSANTSGFLVDGKGGTNTDAKLTNNKVSLTNGQGFAVVGGAVATVLTGNSDSKSRLGFCDETTGSTTAFGNVFGSEFTTCEILQ
jgi:hypothetical protein